MNIESITKFFSPKSPRFSDSSRVTGDSFTITDAMTVIGVASSKCRFGLELYLSKSGITGSENAIEMLVNYGMSRANSVKQIDQLGDDIKSQVVQVLARFAYQDYCRSAASTRKCPDCNGGFIEAEVFNMKFFRADCREIREKARVICKTCKGKGEISNSCRCKGRGMVMDKVESERQGVPVMKTCSKCNGRGFARISFATVITAMREFYPQLGKTTAYDHIQPFFEDLVTKCIQEESAADSVIRKISA